jgi:uncharacterized membrane protein
MQLARWLHVLGVIVWVGGMVFAHFALRPSVQEVLEPPQRLSLMSATLRRFFRWVAASIAVIIATGFGWIIAAGGFARVAPYVHTMTAIGLLMTLIFGYIWLVSFRAFDLHLRAGQVPLAVARLATIRRLVVVNLVLGVITTAVAMLGKGA